MKLVQLIACFCSLHCQGGRAVLCLYGYSNQQPDGLSFPDDVTDPDVGRVAAVTLEVMSLRMELEMLIKVCVCLCLCVLGGQV